jgi:hypothetical protein
MALDQQNDSSKFFLYAVNVMLQMINELPISDDTELAEILEAQLASSVLIETKKEVLASGWDLNTEDEYIFPQDSNGFISVPSNVLDITDADGDIIMKDWRLYSKSEQSAIFTEPQSMSVIWDVDFNSLTHPLRNFITIRAARKFQARTVMDTSVYGYSERDEQEAYTAARRSESFTGKYNMLTSGTFGSTYKVR